MTIKELRALAGLSASAFGEKYGIPTRTIENWEAPEDSKNHRDCPSYVVNLLERVVAIDFKEAYDDESRPNGIH